jgi:hypothetical protein
MIPRFLNNSIRRFAGKILGGLPPQPLTLHARLQALDYAIKNIDHNTRVAREVHLPGHSGSLLGDYLEFGCYDGESFRHALKGAAKQMPWMRFFAFDSFQGLPKPQGVDENGAFREGEYACSQEDFLRNVHQADMDPSRIICVPGWYDQSLTPEVKRRYDIRIAAIVNIDCDLYQSTVPVLRFLTDVIETGTILLFDDWFCFNSDPERGVQRACAEWLVANPSVRLQEWHLCGGFGKCFIVHKKAC